MGMGSFPGIKRPERGVDSAEVKEKLHLALLPLWANGTNNKIPNENTYK